ncbi:PTS lactose/cellobiose transporter subunit IIA [Alkaliphilus peptidifermentans]|uniref:PTS system, cellobiose-specific IIA component n=1 Tax=Alkaliphilus peptidifermentans DSM 18978 TaxID=1120976 RepID=A0A1G5KPC0_9FIRM|nr:PTS lactose/cellobiose transporter subunit IIA [Alkaliphilus peptidifermentans]SCZ01960.1 PTS system, cellobiose-specific IIA component [Alkaliphilus peptidifermentans DSM 18978]
MENEQIIFEIILHAGNARAEAYEALKSAQNNEFDKSIEFIKNADNEIKIAHKSQTNMIQREINGEKVEMSLLFVHAQDHLMTAIAEKSLIENMINLYKRINILENK